MKMFSFAALLFAAFPCSIGAAAAQTAEAAPCDPASLVRVSSDDDRLRIEPEAPFEPQSVHWRGDLNDDGQNDLILFFGNCGSDGACMLGVYAGCGADAYAEILEPEYFRQLWISPYRDSSGWRQLLELGMKIDQDSLDSDEPLYDAQIVGFAFEEGRYWRSWAYRFEDGREMGGRP